MVAIVTVDTLRRMVGWMTESCELYSHNLVVFYNKNQNGLEPNFLWEECHLWTFWRERGVFTSPPSHGFFRSSPKPRLGVGEPFRVPWDVGQGGCRWGTAVTILQRLVVQTQELVQETFCLIFADLPTPNP